MSKQIIQEEVIDNASVKLDKITQKLQNVKSGYREVRRSVGDFKQAMSALNAIGVGVFGSMLPGISSPESVKNPFINTTQAKWKSPLESVVQMGSFMAGGMLADSVITKVSGKLPGTISKILGSTLGRFGGGLLMGAAIQGGYEFGIKPTLEQLSQSNSLSDKFLKTASNRYLSNRSLQNKDVYNVSTDYGGQMNLIRELLGFNESDRRSMNFQLMNERKSRISDIQNVLYRQSRE